MKFTIIEGSIKIGKAMQGIGAEVDLDPVEAERITKKGVCVLEASDLAKARAKAKADAAGAIEKAEAEAKKKIEAEAEAKKKIEAEAEAKKKHGGGK